MFFIRSIATAVLGVPSVLAQTDTSSGTIADLVRYGILGIVLIMVIRGDFRLKREVEERDKRLETQDKVIEDYRQMYEREVIPMLGNVFELMRELREYINRGGGDAH